MNNLLDKIIVWENEFLCDACGEVKTGEKFPMFDENWNEQEGLNKCEGCHKAEIQE